MKAYSRFSFVALMIVVSACGSADFNGGDSAPGENSPASNTETPLGTGQTESNSPVSFSVASVSALPTCNETRTGSLGYVRGEKKFYACENSAWAVADVIPKDSFEIVGRWRFHVDSYEGEQDISETYQKVVKIGDIEVVKYANGSGWFSFSGVYLRDTGNETDWYVADFSYSGVISDAATQFQKILKFSKWAQQRLRIKIDFSPATPVVKIAHDVNGNFTDHPEQAYPLFQEPL